MKRFRFYELQEDVYQTTLYLYLGTDFEGINKHALDKLNITGSDNWLKDENAAEGISIINTDNSYIIHFRKLRPKVETIVHEVVHLVCSHFRHVGIPLTKSTEESYAYYIDYWTELIMKTLRKP